MQYTEAKNCNQVAGIFENNKFKMMEVMAFMALLSMVSLQFVMAEPDDQLDNETLCTHGSIRLVNTIEGRFVAGAMQMCFNDVWGTVCQKDWGYNDAKVVCRELGLSTSGIKKY